MRITRLRYTRWGTITLLFAVLFSAVPAGVFVCSVREHRVRSLRVNKGGYIRRAPSEFYVRREYARTRGVIEVFSTGPAGPGPAATTAAVATSSRLGRLAQPLQADLPGPEQSVDSYGDREILVRTWRRRRRRLFSKNVSRETCSFYRGSQVAWIFGLAIDVLDTRLINFVSFEAF